MTAEGTYSAEQVNQLLTCPVCLDRYNHPKILPCQHTVCRSPCLEGLIDRFTRMIRCPECRAEHFVPRTGVDGFPTNITISGFLDLQAHAGPPPQAAGGTGQDSGATTTETGPSQGAAAPQQPARSFGKCPVCETEGERVKCLHCDRLLCVTCKQSHTDQMKMEVLRLVTQIRRGIPKLSKCLGRVEHRAEVVKQHVTSVKGEVTSSVDKYIKELKDRETSLHSELETFLLGELRSLRLHQETIEVEMASISSYCDSMETFLNAGASGAGNGSIPEADLVNMKHQCSEYMQQLRNAENEPIPPMRRARYIYQNQAIQSTISGFGSITSSSPGGGGTPVSQAQAPPTGTQATTSRPQRTNQRARWGDRSPRLPMGAQPSVRGGGTSGRGTERQSNGNQQPDFFTSRPSRSDESWLQSSPQVGTTPQSVYLPSRTEDYMYQMATNTDDIFEVIEEIRRQEEWELNASIRESSRNRNTRQNVNLFPSPRARSHPTAGGEDRMAGLMGGGGGATPRGAANGGGGATPRGAVNGGQPAERTPRPAVGAPTGNGHAVTAGNTSQVDNTVMQDLEEEIHNMDVLESTSNQTAANQRPRGGGANQRTNQNSRPAATTSRSQNRAGPSRITEAGAAALARSNQETPSQTTSGQSNGSPVNMNANSRTQRPPNNRNTATSNRGGGNAGRRNQPNSNRQNTNRTNRHQNANSTNRGGANTNGTSRNTSTSESQSVAANNSRPRRISQQGVGGSLPRSRTFVQDEPTTAETATDLPSVSNNGMSFSIAFDEDNTTTDLNSANNNYRVNYTEKASAVLSLGNGRGNGNEDFTWPRGVAISPNDDRIIIADSSNHRVKVYNFNGSLVSTFGSYGQNEGEFDCLAGIAVNPMGQIVISDRYNHRIQVFDASGTFLHTFGSEGNEDGQLNYPWGVATDSSGFIYVCDKENHRIQVFQQNGTFVRKFGSLGNQPGKLENPHYLAVTSDNRVLVSDSSNHRLQLFTNTGRFIKTIGGMGTALGQVKYPKGIAVDPNGYIIVADSGNSRVQVLQPNGRYHYHFGSSGTQSGQFRGIEGLALSKTGTIVVTDKDNHRIQTF